ncbi:MAG TPA: universal stress protein [Bryobacteraceae bacterium]|nr:universal stress protein [Bryobacteraceae bacterium]
MQTFEKILFPVDLSDNCTATAPFVEALAKKFNAELTLMHVLEIPPAYFTDWYGYISLVDTQAIRDARQGEFDQYLKDRFAGLHVQRILEEGDPSRIITKFAEEHATDLIMLPTHGYGIFRSLLLGSVTAKVLHDALCPVWTAVHVENAPPATASFERIMCAVDLTDSSIATMRFASQLARDFNAKLWLVHAVPAPEAGPERYFDSDLQKFLEEDARKTIGKMQEAAGIAAQLCVGAGEVAHVVREAATHHNADLVITGRGHSIRTLGRLRTNVYAIIRQSPCPVISV